MKKFLLFYFLFLFFLLSFFSSGVIDSQDGFQYLAVARNIYYKGEPTAPVYEYDVRKNIHMSTIVGKDGKTYSLTGLGYSLVYLPAVAFTDIVYRIYNVSPPVHFPLENDWLILLTASFTNSFFGAMLGVILFVYLLELGLSKKQAIFISLAGLFSTNLLVYSKYSFPHMMFVTFLVLSFYFIKKYFKTKQKLFLIGSGVAYGIHAITYNQTFILSTIPLALYFIILTGRQKFNFKYTRSKIYQVSIFLAGFIPFVLIYLWYENTRAMAEVNLASLTSVPRIAAWTVNVPIGVLFEGLYGQLFSPGRSIFIYSPILLIIIFFWHKIREVIKAELIVFIVLSLIYIFFYATLYTVGTPEQGIAALWHGESSWGPRYLTPIIPFGMLLIGHIYQNLPKKVVIFVFFPLIFIGLYIGLLGILMPYQIKFHDLQEKFFVNSTEYTNYSYSNLLPRYSPILMTSKKLVKLIQTFPKILDHGEYNVRFYDGVDFPFPVGPERWRAIDGKGYIFFDNPQNDPVKKISLGLINHPIGEASGSAILQFTLNNKPLLKNQTILKLSERKLIELALKNEQIKDQDNLLIIDVNFQMPFKEEEFIIPSNRNFSLLQTNPQILGMISFAINDREVNRESLDFPYISQLGPAMTNKTYLNYGGENKDPWKSWHIHTQMYERIPDFWWIRNLYYWDIPKMPIIFLSVVIVIVTVYSGFKTFQRLKYMQYAKKKS